MFIQHIIKEPDALTAEPITNEKTGKSANYY